MESIFHLASHFEYLHADYRYLFLLSNSYISKGVSHDFFCRQHPWPVRQLFVVFYISVSFDICQFFTNSFS